MTVKKSWKGRDGQGRAGGRAERKIDYHNVGIIKKQNNHTLEFAQAGMLTEPFPRDINLYVCIVFISVQKMYFTLCPDNVTIDYSNRKCLSTLINIYGC